MRRYTTSKSMLERIHDGDDHHAWAEFYDKYRGMIVAIGKSHNLTQEECDDLLQNTMTTFWRRLNGFVYQPEKGKFRGFLSSIAHGCAIRIWKKRGKHEISMEKLPEYSAPVDQTFMEEWEHFVLERALEELKKRISTDCFEAFHLSCIENVPIPDVVRVTGKTANNIYNIRSRCVTLLRNILREIEA